MRRVVITFVTLAALIIGPLGVRTSGQAPGAVKAAFLFNVLNFVEWPAASFATANAPLKIAVIAPRTPDDFVGALKGRAVRGHQLTVQTYDRADIIEPSQVVFVTADAVSQLKSVIQKLGASPVLTVVEQDLDAPVEATMALGVVQAKLAFAVNLDLADAAGLQINPNLLKLAKSVKSARARTR